MVQASSLNASDFFNSLLGDAFPESLKPVVGAYAASADIYALGMGRPVAEIADDMVTARRLNGASGGGAGQPLRWREIEVEVPEPEPELQRAAADLLQAAGARPAGHGSKLARLLSS